MTIQKLSIDERSRLGRLSVNMSRTLLDISGFMVHGITSNEELKIQMSSVEYAIACLLQSGDLDKEKICAVVKNLYEEELKLKREQHMYSRYICVATFWGRIQQGYSNTEKTKHKETDLERRDILMHRIGVAMGTVGYILSHGYDSRKPFATGRQRLERALGGVMHAIVRFECAKSGGLPYERADFILGIKDHFNKTQKIVGFEN